MTGQNDNELPNTWTKLNSCASVCNLYVIFQVLIVNVWGDDRFDCDDDV